jgi:dihydropyrimidine dehydrogenase (NAD+) subunit PreT
LSGVNALRAGGETREGVEDAVAFISDLRQAGDLSSLPVGRNVVVIGGGMTAIDAAVQSKLLGAESVTLLYRRGREAMPASRYEQDLAASKGVRFVFNAMPVEILGNGAVTASGWNTRSPRASR